MLILRGEGDESISKWASDLFEVHVMQNCVGGALHLKTDGRFIGSMADMRAQFKVRTLDLAKPFGAATTALAVECAIFEFAFLGGHIWVNAKSLYDGLGLKVLGTGPKWFQSNVEKWLGWGVKLGFPSVYVRRSMGYGAAGETQSDAAKDPDRVLTFSSCHLSIVLLEAVASCFGTNKRQGGVRDASASLAFRRLYDGVIAFARGDCRTRKKSEGSERIIQVFGCDDCVVFGYG